MMNTLTRSLPVIGAILAAILLIGLGTAMLPSNTAGGERPKALSSPSYRIFPSNVTQTETFITTHPHNQSILFASANTINFTTGFISEGVYVTTNAGASWFGSDTCKGSPISFHRGDPGIAIDRNGTFILIRLGFTAGLFSHYSNDNGFTWSSQRRIASDDQERASLASDGFPASSNYGRTYAVWVRFSPPYPVFFAYTDDGAQNWSTPTQINNPPRRSVGGEITIGADGSVYVCWAGVLNVSPFTEMTTGFARSTNGGATWFVNEEAFAMNGIAGTFPHKGNIRVNGIPRIDVDRSGGSRHGWIYIVTTQRNLAPAGTDADIILNRSTDGGVTWSAGIRVNQDPLNNGKTQYFPAIHVDDGGGVNVLYYCDRNTTNDSTGVFISRSTDGGNTWNDHEISDHNFRPEAIGGLGQGYQGDNIDMTSVGSTLWPVWMDNSTGIYQIWTRPIDITLLSVEEPSLNLPRTMALDQNYPNPFNPSTNIRFTLQTSGFTSLRVYDVLGRQVAVLVDGDIPAGSHEVKWDAEGLASGIYLYRLVQERSVLTRKMMVMQ